jgi:TRAP-type C4-dicarboxylate transport system permease small subunit
MSRFLAWLFGAGACIAGAALTVLMAITIIDIAGRHLGILNLRGTIEISTAVTVLIGFLAFPYSFLIGGHLVLDTATAHLSPRVNRVIDCVWLLVAAIAFSVVAGYMWLGAADAYDANELSTDLQMPMVVLWVPAAVGMSVSPLACLLALYRKIYSAAGHVS